MSAEERQKILQLVEHGKITAEEAILLIRALDEHQQSEDWDSSDEGDW
ncbi:MAG: SHOCT-like domain-containing protein [Anaerolineales bacterium]